MWKSKFFTSGQISSSEAAKTSFYQELYKVLNKHQSFFLLVPRVLKHFYLKGYLKIQDGGHVFFLMAGKITVSTADWTGVGVGLETR